MRWIPREYHPQACALSVTGLFFLLLSKPLPLSTNAFSGMAWCWIAWVVVLMDKGCPAAFFTALSFALLCTCNYLRAKQRKIDKEFELGLADYFSLLFTITFMVGVFLGICPL